jgi:hypothetical protein
MVEDQDGGQGAPQVVDRWSGHTVASPAAHSVISQPCVPASPFGQWTTHVAPAAHVVWHGPLSQVNSQVLPGPQAQDPFAQVPEHDGLSPWQVTWQGGAPQANAQVEPTPQVHAPFAQVALHEAPSPQPTLHGGL